MRAQALFSTPTQLVVLKRQLTTNLQKLPKEKAKAFRQRRINRISSDPHHYWSKTNIHQENIDPVEQVFEIVDNLHLFRCTKPFL